MKTNTRMATGFTLVELLVVIAIIVTLAGVATPVLLSQKKKGDHAKAVQNAKQIGYALFNFENDNNRYPDDDTIDSLGDSPVLAAADTSNYYFSQLISGGYVDQEAPFFCKTGFTVEPDNDKTSGNILDVGEVGFSYVMRQGTGGEVGLSSSLNTALPLVVAPVALTGDDFSQDPYNKRSVVLRIDMSVTDPRIDDEGVITVKTATGTADLFTTGADTVWGSDLDPVLQQPGRP